MTTTQETTKTVPNFLDALVWDGIPRLDRWLIEYAGAEDSPYVRSASRAMLVAAVRRARHPGCRFDQLPIITGPQGCCKSSALRLLAVQDDWFTDSLRLASSDTRQIIEATAGKWIVEASELEGLFDHKRAALAENDDDEEDEEEDDDENDDEADAADEDDEDAEEDELPPAAALKAFLARSVDEARMAYQVECTRVPRQFVVVGTTAATPYLPDPTGNRRYWTISVERFDLARLAEARDQLWAEAAAAEATGESIFLDATIASA